MRAAPGLSAPCRGKATDVEAAARPWDLSRHAFLGRAKGILSAACWRLETETPRQFPEARAGNIFGPDS